MTAIMLCVLISGALLMISVYYDKIKDRMAGE